MTSERMTAEEYIASLPMWAKKKNSVAQVRSFLDLLGQHAAEAGTCLGAGIAGVPRRTGAAAGKTAGKAPETPAAAPDDGVPVIHVAGTNGKGSVCAYLTRALRDSGLRVGTFVSPHLVDVKERILIDGVPVSGELFDWACGEVKRVAALASGQAQQFDRLSRMESGFNWPTYFEFLYYMAMLIFRRAAVDAVVLETGLGGRLDATNSCRPALTIITSISKDHMQYLGDTTAKIAAEKAGILKPGIPVVYDPKDPMAERVILKRAEELGCAAYAARPGGSGEEREDPFDFLKVPYQRQNALVALTAWKVLRELPAFSRVETEKKFIQSVRSTRWAGRMEEIRPDVFLDGGHNEDGIRAMAEAACRICRERGKRPVLLTSAVSDKDLGSAARRMTEGLRPVRVYIAPLNSYRSADTGKLSELYRENGNRDVREYQSVAEAYDAAVRELCTGQEAAEQEILFCAGSLYLVGEILAHLQTS